MEYNHLVSAARLVQREDGKIACLDFTRTPYDLDVADVFPAL